MRCLHVAKPITNELCRAWHQWLYLLKGSDCQVQTGKVSLPGKDHKTSLNVSWTKAVSQSLLPIRQTSVRRSITAETSPSTHTSGTLCLVENAIRIHLSYFKLFAKHLINLSLNWGRRDLAGQSQCELSRFSKLNTEWRYYLWKMYSFPYNGKPW